MVKHELMIIADYSQDTALSLEELCEICHISSDLIHDLIAYEIIHPKQPSTDRWVFDLAELKRIQIALRLQRDLEVNLAGVAVVLDLLDELEALRKNSELLERHFL
jgi:chaperone modulatory protein CbpM